MALILRNYQEEIKSKVYDAWSNGSRSVLLVMATGLGKTKTFSSIAIDRAILPAPMERLPTAILVHRKELVQQISLTLSEEDINHNIIAPRPVILGIVAAQRQLFKKQFYDYNAPITVISVDTLNSRILHHEKWAKSVKLWITDEAAHLLKSNKWGRAIEYFPNAIGLGVTATPQRLDKRGLGRHADGVFDVMIEGPGTKWGIENGFLSKYKIAIPASDYEKYLRKASDSSDYSKEAMVQASQQSHIIGDVVENYQKFAKGKQAILFATDIDTASKMERQFIGAGIKAKLLTGLTDDKIRLQSLIDFREKRIQVLLNVDLFDEGLDVPGIECVIMARPTMSLSKFLQMVGRGLRIMQGKPYMILIDHVGNVKRHGLPCSPRDWTLDRIVKRQDKVNLIRICSNPDCNAPYDRTLTECPWCGTEAITQSRDSEGSGRVPPEMVDGDLHLIDPETIREFEKSSILEDPQSMAEKVFAATNSKPAALKAKKDREQRIAMQSELAHIIAQWAGVQRLRGYSDRQIHKKFYLYREMTITQALSEPKAEMQEIMEALKWELKI